MIARLAAIATFAALALLASLEPAAAQSGSFAWTCQRCSGGGGTITCLCQRRNGQWTWARANYSRCPRQSLTNLDGQLVCGP
ncbi:MAG TPA: hypothetical protein VM434_14165 [Beijerinckiaceae bacterium]|nr:hypothetical protein [Beijerinckiaceae bacterium]